MINIKEKITLKEFKKLPYFKEDLEAFNDNSFDKRFYYNKKEIIGCTFITQISDDFIFMSFIKNSREYQRHMLFDIYKTIDFYIENNLKVCMTLDIDTEKQFNIIKKRRKITMFKNNVVIIEK